MIIYLVLFLNSVKSGSDTAGKAEVSEPVELRRSLRRRLRMEAETKGHDDRLHNSSHRRGLIQQPSRQYFPVGQPDWLPARIYFNDENPYIMDAKRMGNLGRYFNHSCNPNIFVQNVFIDSHDPRFPEVAFFTKRSVD